MKTAPISVEYIDHMGTDISVVNAARVSFAKESSATDDGTVNTADAKLIGYLAKHDHWSPFAHTSVSLRVKAPIFLARQLVKHTVGCAWNEVSRRYVDEEPEFYIPEVLHTRPDNMKQGAGEVHQRTNTWIEYLKHTTAVALGAYQELIARGIAPEEARMVLPLNTMTEWIWTGSLVYWARVYKLRKGGDAQGAAGEVADLIAQVVKPLFPVSWGALA
jgi:thymidylate synthase (FAD)